MDLKALVRRLLDALDDADSAAEECGCDDVKEALDEIRSIAEEIEGSSLAARRLDAAKP